MSLCDSGELKSKNRFTKSTPQSRSVATSKNPKKKGFWKNNGKSIQHICRAATEKPLWKVIIKTNTWLKTKNEKKKKRAMAQVFNSNLFLTTEELLKEYLGITLG